LEKSGDLLLRFRKVGCGYKSAGNDPIHWFSANLESPISLAPLTAEISMASCRLPDFHGDPADRMIVATAITLGIPLITADEKIIRWNETYQLVKVIGL
jgi:PIN domain nuclease of toxin-antitoxin system